MTSPRKLLANRRNALRSTGARSREGKVTASRNALCHGLASALSQTGCTRCASRRQSSIASARRARLW